MSSKEKYQGERVLYEGKFRRVQVSKGWKYIFYKGKRVGLSTLLTVEDIPVTVEGWQKLYNQIK